MKNNCPTFKKSCQKKEKKIDCYHDKCKCGKVKQKKSRRCINCFKKRKRGQLARIHKMVKYSGEKNAM